MCFVCWGGVRVGGGGGGGRFGGLEFGLLRVQTYFRMMDLGFTYCLTRKEGTPKRLCSGLFAMSALLGGLFFIRWKASPDIVAY